jgi:intracellular sulfur oxidation DsrE/DsrF family protein
MNDHNISDEYLNSFVDNQLNSSEQIQAYDTIRRNDKLKEKVCELRSLKEAIKYAYNQPPLYLRPTTGTTNRNWAPLIRSLAACLLLLAGGISGWLTHTWANRENEQEISSLVQAVQRIDPVTETRKIIVHISNSKPAKLKAALDETESLLDTYKRSHKNIQVEFIANKRGVDLLRTGMTGYEKRIGLMQEKYPNLSFLVCGNTLSKLKISGEIVQLLPHTTVASSAVEQINKRLHQGWGYVRI